MKLKEIKKTDFNYFKKIHAQWGDMDGLRHINNAVYYSYIDSVVNAYLLHNGA